MTRLTDLFWTDFKSIHEGRWRLAVYDLGLNRVSYDVYCPVTGETVLRRIVTRRTAANRTVEDVEREVTAALVVKELTR